MKSDFIFFGEEGLTSTSANYLANLAKETYVAEEQRINAVSFYDETVQVIGNPSKTILQEGTTNLDNIQDYLERIAKYKSFIAWVREAIKARQRLVQWVNDKNPSDYGITFDDMQEPQSPVLAETITTDEVLSTWNIKKRNQYLYLETLCSEIGSYIHPNGALANAKSELIAILSKPRTTSGSGRDTVIYTKTPSMSLDEVTEVFMQLQNTYRSYQAQLNALKHEIESEIQNDGLRKKVEFEKNYEKYKEEMVKYMNEKNSRMAQFQSLREKELQGIYSLKIIIPDSLKNVYTELSKSGK